MPPDAQSLPWFLDLGTGYLVRKTKSVVLYGPGVGSSRLRVVGPDEASFLPEAVAAALDGPWTKPIVVSLHALACAERACDLLTELTAVNQKWSFEERLRLFTHAIEVPRFEDFEGSWGRFERASERISFAHVVNDPWRTASLSHDLVVHEVCHALLDGWKDWYITSADLADDEPSAAETGAISECLGDLLSMYSAGRLVEARRRALQETSGELSNNPCNLSRFAELPGYTRILRDLSNRVSRADAEHLSDGNPQKPYMLAAALGSAIYETIGVRTRTMGNDEEALRGALEEVLGGVFSSIQSLPNGRVTIDGFVISTLASCESTTRELLGLALEERGFAG